MLLLLLLLPPYDARKLVLVCLGLLLEVLDKIGRSGRKSFCCPGRRDPACGAPPLLDLGGFGCFIVRARVRARVHAWVSVCLCVGKGRESRLRADSLGARL